MLGMSICRQACLTDCEDLAQDNLLHTGADDAIWHGWDMRDLNAPVFSIRSFPVLPYPV